MTAGVTVSVAVRPGPALALSVTAYGPGWVAAGSVRRRSSVPAIWAARTGAAAGVPGACAVAETIAGRFDLNRTVTGWPGRGAAGSMPSTVSPAGPAWSRGGRSRRPLPAGTILHGPVATGTTTLPFESRIRNGPKAATTA